MFDTRIQYQIEFNTHPEGKFKFLSNEAVSMFPSGVGWATNVRGVVVGVVAVAGVVVAVLVVIVVVGSNSGRGSGSSS